jgi:hypothetical protein
VNKPRSRSGRGGAEKNPCSCWEHNPSHPARGGGDLELRLIEEPEGKTPLGRPRHICKDNIKTDLKYGVCRLDANGSE